MPDGDRDRRLESLGYPLDRTTPEGALFEPFVIDGDTLDTSGQIPLDGDRLLYVGQVPLTVNVADATRAAALCAANVLRTVRKHLGSLDRVERVLRVTGYVNSADNFAEQHLVINGASQLVRDIFGDAGRHARTALGMSGLPRGASVEVDMILKLRPRW